MSLAKITGAGVYYMEGAEVHGDIVSPVRGDLAVYTYAAAGEFIGKEYSYSGSAWFAREQITETNSGKAAGLVVVADIYGVPDGAETRIAHISAPADTIAWADGAAIVPTGKIIMFDTFTNSPTKARITLLAPNANALARADWLFAGVNEGSHANYETLFAVPHIAGDDTGQADIGVRVAGNFMPVIEFDIGDTIIADIGILAVMASANTASTEGDCVVAIHAW